MFSDPNSGEMPKPSSIPQGKRGNAIPQQEDNVMESLPNIDFKSRFTNESLPPDALELTYVSTNAREKSTNEDISLPDVLRALAVSYAELGLPVFPLRPGSKLPVSENGHLDATNDPKVVYSDWTHPCKDKTSPWYDRSCNWNIGIRGVGHLILDFDPRSLA